MLTQINAIEWKHPQAHNQHQTKQSKEAVHISEMTNENGHYVSLLMGG